MLGLVVELFSFMYLEFHTCHILFRMVFTYIWVNQYVYCFKLFTNPSKSAITGIYLLFLEYGQ
jgi:hypothetical protein